MKYSTNQFKQGLKISIDGEPCSIISHEFHKPGKGQAVMRTKLYNLRTQKVWERTFKSGESVEAADVQEKEYQFLYVEGTNYVFMDQNTFEQIEEFRAFELLRTGLDRTHYLCVKEAKIIAMTCTHAALKRKDLVRKFLLSQIKYCFANSQFFV